MLDFRQKLKWLCVYPPKVEFADPIEELVVWIVEELPKLVQKGERHPFGVILEPKEDGSFLLDYTEDFTTETECPFGSFAYCDPIFSYEFFDLVIEELEKRGFEIAMCNDSAYVYIT